MNGFCGLEVGQPACSCVLGWSGDHCDFEEDDYTSIACVNGFIGSNLDTFVCYCHSGWQGEDCSQAIVDYRPCNEIDCNNHGYCILDEDSKVYCSCNDGYTGDQCQNEGSTCSTEYLMNIAATVYDENWNAGLDCSFFIGLLWSDMISNGLTGYPGLCTCLDSLTTYITLWSDNLGCVIEENFPMSLKEMSQLHCNTCTDDEILDMKAAIQDYSETCDMFITHREEMPLYWRTPLKCECLNSLGNSRDEVGDWVYCPFTNHAARTDLTAYDNCNDKSVTICDFKYLKNKLETNMKTRNPSGFKVCTSAMIDLMDMLASTPGFFRNLPDNWCPCYESIAEYWSDGLDLLDCNAVTFYEFTIKDLFLLYCNDESFRNKDDLWKVAKVITVASYEAYTTAATCQNFVVYAAALPENAIDSSVSRAKTLLCDCFEGLELVAEAQGYEINDGSISWNTFIPDEFADAILDIQDLLELLPNVLADTSVSECEFVRDNSIFVEYIHKDAIIEADTIPFDSTKTETNSISYTMLNLCLSLVCVVLTISNSLMYLSSSDRRSNFPSVMIL